MLAFIVGQGRLAAARRPAPRLRPGWARVRVRLAGVCNTDLEILRGYHNFRGTPGHEFVGQVEAVEPPAGGRAARRRAEREWLGRWVVGEINIPCAALGLRPACAFCRRGIPVHCLRRRVMGIVAHHGAFAQSLTLPLANLHRVPDSVPDECAVFTEPLAAACQVLAQVPLEGIGEAAVLGDGKLGQLIARVLAAAGLRVTLFGRHPAKLALARAAGVAAVLVSARRGRRAARLPRAPARRWPLVVEATGSPDGLAGAAALVRPRGVLVLKSTFRGTAEMETWPLVVDEVTLVGSRCGPFPRALELLRSRRVDPRPLISRVFPLAEAPEALRYAARPGVMKVLLKGSDR